MRITETLDFFQNLKNGTTEKSEIKLYDNYIAILLDLNDRDLTQTQLQSIESELENLHLNAESENRIKYFKKKLAELQKFLKDKLSLVAEGYYAGIGVGAGILFGSLFTLFFQSFLGAYSILIGINGGMILGAILGSIKDAEAKKQGRVFASKLK